MKMKKGVEAANPSFHHHFVINHCIVSLAARVLASLVIRCLRGKMQRKMKQHGREMKQWAQSNHQKNENAHIGRPAGSTQSVAVAFSACDPDG